MSNIAYKKLLIWQKADELAYEIYNNTGKFSKEETYGIRSQIRRAALSVPVNIVEGYGRQNKKEFRQFLNIALGSLAETEYLIDFSHRLKYLDDENREKLQNIRQETGRMLWKFYKSLD